MVRKLLNQPENVAEILLLQLWWQKADDVTLILAIKDFPLLSYSFSELQTVPFISWKEWKPLDGRRKSFIAQNLPIPITWSSRNILYAFGKERFPPPVAPTWWKWLFAGQKSHGREGGSVSLWENFPLLVMPSLFHRYSSANRISASIFFQQSPEKIITPESITDEKHYKIKSAALVQ